LFIIETGEETFVARSSVIGGGGNTALDEYAAKAYIKYMMSTKER
jgi:hypothetical protein